MHICILEVLVDAVRCRDAMFLRSGVRRIFDLVLGRVTHGYRATQVHTKLLLIAAEQRIKV